MLFVLLGVPEMAALGGITASTLQGYISRGENDVPPPQATVGSRAQWSRPVAEDWAEARRRSSEGLREAMSASGRHRLAPGAAQIRDRFSESFFGFLWKRPDIRKRWVLRQRNEPSVREVADQLAFEVADSLRQIIPTDALGPTIRHAVLEDFATSLRGAERRGGELKAFDLILSVPLAKMLGWFIQHFPTSAQWYIGEIMSEAQQQLDIPAQVTGEALRRSAITTGNSTRRLRRSSSPVSSRANRRAETRHRTRRRAEASDSGFRPPLSGQARIIPVGRSSGPAGCGTTSPRGADRFSRPCWCVVPGVCGGRRRGRRRRG
ncbi:hypothetical protein ACIPSA_46625 [Streptomyces sp. NPDC086549]|uniref:hypothetical protein n=1 Tax=Streptomyces sp. NPDC086549 TaxID=3365752 RepID=UPI003804E38F